MGIIAKMSSFVKKLFAIVLALVLAIGTVNNNIPVDITTEIKNTVWEIGYHSRCRHNGIRRIRSGRGKRVAKKILLAPLALIVGVAGAEAAPIGHGNFIVEYIKGNEVKAKKFANFKEASDAYTQIAKVDPSLPRQLSNCTTRVPIILLSHNWNKKAIYRKSAIQFMEDAKARLIEARIKTKIVEEVLKMRASDLKKVVVSRDTDKLEEIEGVGPKTSKRIIFALKPICRAETLPLYGSREFTRVTLNNDVYSENLLMIDTIKKTVGPVEAKAIALGGKNAVIHCVSYIADPRAENLDELERAQQLSKLWEKFAYDGIILEGNKYVPLGIGTNAAKECKSIWVLESIHGQMEKELFAKTNSNWKTTVAKKLAYMVGLQAVPRKSVGIPFVGEDFAIMPSVFSDVRVNATKEFLDGHEEDLDDYNLTVNRSDGYFIIDIPDAMRPELINRMISRGEDPEEAEAKLKAFMADHSINSYRANGAALKGLGDKRVNAHAYLWSKGVTKTPDGRDLNTIAIFADETVIKTAIGKGKAYETFEDWCDAIRTKLDLGICVKGHGKKRKDTSYQVVQCLCEAAEGTIARMARKTIDLINDAHSVNGASRLLNREQGHILRIFNELINVRDIKERVTKKLETLINDAFSGKLLRNSYYAFCTPDPFYILNGWFGLPLEGCLKAGEISVPGVRLGKVTTWRSPVVHPNSVRVENNVRIPDKYREFLNCNVFCITMNSIDDTSMAQDLDWDGDHKSVSDDDDLIEAAEATLAVWDRLIIWETPNAEKTVVTRKDVLSYIAGLTHRNELGLTVYGLNALLNRVIWRKNKITKERYTEVINIPKRGVNFKKFASNVLVDAGKHGGSEIDEPKESSQSKWMIQPWAKLYRDAVESKCLWKVIDRSDNSERVFEDESSARAYVKKETQVKIAHGETPKFEVLNNLDDLARLDNKDMTHAAGTLNKVFVEYSNGIDRSTTIYDAPEEQFDFRKLMFNPDDLTYRGITGLIRKGEMTVVEADGRKLRPDQGLFDALSRRYDVDMKTWLDDDTHKKDEEDTSFDTIYRVNALAAIQEFAESYGRTLEDAYDVITWVMFTLIDKQYATMDGRLDYQRQCLWSAYWAIFGGMAEEAAERWEKEEK